MPPPSHPSFSSAPPSARRRGLSCSKCGRGDLAASDFNSDRSRKNGRQRKCRLCTQDGFKKWYRENRKKFRPKKPALTDRQIVLLADHVHLAESWFEHSGAAWIALRDAVRTWNGIRDFQRYAKVAMKRAVWRAKYSDCGYVWIRRDMEWRRREVTFTDYDNPDLLEVL